VRSLRTWCGLLKKTFRLLAGLKQFLNSSPQSGFSRASHVEVCCALADGQLPRCAENSQLALERLFHEVPGMFYYAMRKTKLKGANGARESVRSAEEWKIEDRG
jgi:hypothetical protein